MDKKTKKYPGLGERLKKLRERKGLTQEDFRKYGALSSIYNWESGTTEPYKKTLELIERDFGLRPEWLRYGIEPMFASDIPSPQPPESPKPTGFPKKASKLGGTSKRAFGPSRSSTIEYDDEVPKLVINPLIDYVNSDFVKLAVFKRTGAGNEMVGVEYEQIDTVVIPKKLYGTHLVPFKVSGESMEKLIMENSIVLVDTSPRDDIEEGKIYCFRIPYRGFIIRKVEKSLDGLYLIPYNKTFEERRIAWDEFNPEWVIGRVIWNIINPVGF